MNVAIIGCGQQGRRHAKAYKAAGCHVLWAFDTDEEQASKFADEGWAETAGSAQASAEWLIVNSDVDIVSITSHDGAHEDQVWDALRSRKHVFCEKPLATSIVGLSRIKEEWEASGKVLMCNLPLRKAPAFVALKQLVKSGEMGEVYAFDADYLYGRLPKLTEGWRGRDPNYSCFLGGAIHLVDLMVDMLGIPQSVSAVGNGICSRGSQYQGNDYVAATYRYESGCVGRITANFGSQTPHRHSVRVYGTKQSWLFDGTVVWKYTRDGSLDDYHAYTWADEEKTLIPEFLSCIESGERYQPEFDSMLATLQAVESVRDGSVEVSI